LSPVRAPRSTARSNFGERPELIGTGVAFSPTPSAALRYWNMARQRYCRRLARSCNTLRVSADPVAKPAAHSRAESRGSRPSKAAPGERLTLRWREEDSNSRSLPPRRERLWAATPGKHCRFGLEPVSGSAFRAAVSDWQCREEPFAGAGPMVRILLPPAESHQRTELSEFRPSARGKAAFRWSAHAARVISSRSWSTTPTRRRITDAVGQLANTTPPGPVH
jgi:hypothetical protein